MQPESPHALVEQRDAILIVTMNRPRVRNALSAEHLTELFELDVENSELLDKSEWNRRSVGKKACELLLRPLRPLL